MAGVQGAGQRLLLSSVSPRRAAAALACLVDDFEVCIPHRGRRSGIGAYPDDEPV